MARGSKPGERRGGRKKGTPNKATAELRKAARQYTKSMLVVLADVAKNSESDAARVAAARELLDRGHGKPTQPLSGADDDSPPLLVEVTYVHPDSP